MKYVAVRNFHFYWICFTDDYFSTTFWSRIRSSFNSNLRIYNINLSLYTRWKLVAEIYKMKTFNIIITSRNKNSINDFLLFFNKNKFYNLNVIKKCFQKRIEKKKLTILKSPHVNKRAQEQFESRLFKKQLTVKTTKNLKYLIYIKRLGYDLFPDINIRLKYIINNKDILKLGLKIFNPNYFKMNKYYNFIGNNFNVQRLSQLKKKLFLLKLLLVKKANHTLKIFDLYGEFLKPYV